MTEQLLKRAEKTLEVTAKDEKYVNAISKLFTQMRELVYRELEGRPLISLRATEIYFDDVQVQKYMERFLFFFWPRERQNYTIKARIMVEMDYLDLKKEDIE